METSFLLLKNRVVKNAGWIIGCKVVQAILGFFITMLTARYMGPSNYGTISYAASVIAFVSPIAKLGLDAILVNELITRPEEEGKTLGTSIALSFSSSVICVIGIMVFHVFADPGDKVTIIVCTLYSLVLLANAVELVMCWFHAHLMSQYSALAILTAYLVKAAYQIWLLVNGKSLFWFACIAVLDVAAIDINLLVQYKRRGTQKLVVSFMRGKELLSKSKYYVTSNMLTAIFAQAGTILLHLLTDEVSTGYYAAAVTCTGLTGFVFAAIIDSMRPAILQAHKESEESFRKNMRQLYAVIIYLSLAQSVVMTLLAKPIIFILYGESYMPAVRAMQLTVWYTTFSYAGPVRDIWILAKEKQRYIWVINLLGAVLNVVLNALVIPVWGINGAALATVITQVFTNFILGFILKPIRDNNRLMLEALNIGALYREIKGLTR